MRDFYSKANQLDEMQEQTLRKIESQGFWLLWVGLLAAILVQPLLQVPSAQIPGEFTVFLAADGYLLLQCLRNGIVWKSLLSEILAGIFTFILTLGLMQLTPFLYHKKRKDLDADDPSNE